jgi:hypothetical protein
VILKGKKERERYRNRRKKEGNTRKSMNDKRGRFCKYIFIWNEQQVGQHWKWVGTTGGGGKEGLAWKEGGEGMEAGTKAKLRQSWWTWLQKKTRQVTLW